MSDLLDCCIVLLLLRQHYQLILRLWSQVTTGFLLHFFSLALNPAFWHRDWKRMLNWILYKHQRVNQLTLETKLVDSMVIHSTHNCSLSSRHFLVLCFVYSCTQIRCPFCNIHTMSIVCHRSLSSRHHLSVILNVALRFVFLCVL